MATLLEGVDGKRDETLQQDLVSPYLFADPSCLNNGNVGQWLIVRKWTLREAQFALALNRSDKVGEHHCNSEP